MQNKNVTPLVTPDSGFDGDFELTPAGVYIARCYRMMDIGTQDNTFTPKGGKTTQKSMRQIVLFFELLLNQKNEKVFQTDGVTPFVINNTYTWSMSKNANLRALLNNWSGEPFTDEEAKNFEITKVLGTYCQMQVVHNQGKSNPDRTYANIGSVMACEQLEDGYGINDIDSFSIEQPDMEMFESFPEYWQNKIREAREWTVESGDGTGMVNGRLTPEGNVEIEDLDKKPAGITKDDVKKMPF